MQLYNAPWQSTNATDTTSTEQKELFHVLQDIEKKNERSAINLVNALFLSSTSQSLDKVCFNIFAKIGDTRSLELVHKKFPSPHSISMSLVPSYIQVLSTLGGEDELELLARVASVFGGLYRNELLDAFDKIIDRIGPISVNADVVEGLQKLFEATESSDKIRVLNIAQSLRNDLLHGLYICGLESEAQEVRRFSITALGRLGTELSKRALVRAFRNEYDDEVIPDFEPWIFPVTKVA